MMRYLFIVFLFVLVAFFFLKIKSNDQEVVLPVFLQHDAIAEAHHTQMDVDFKSIYKPDSIKLAEFLQDYSNIWAHLNHLYVSNDIEAGKEYYTEQWFRQLNRHYEGKVMSTIKRQDVQHHLLIENWAWDNLVCTLSDTNLVFNYQYPDGSLKSTKANLKMVLLFQGDHWRIDALSILDEIEIKEDSFY